MTDHSSRLRVVILALLATGQIGCLNDPFDPWLGPRLPCEGHRGIFAEDTNVFEGEKGRSLGISRFPRRP